MQYKIVKNAIPYHINTFYNDVIQSEEVALCVFMHLQMKQVLI